MPNGQLEERLRQVVERARRSWPAGWIRDENFAAYLAQRVPSSSGAMDWLGKVQVEDLYLSCACAAGHPEALAAFETRILPQVGSAIARIDSSAAFITEVEQQIRRKVLVGEASQSPKIADYAGFGPLVHWLRAVAVRTALNFNRSRGRQDRPVPDEVLLKLPVQAGDPELDYLKRRYRGDFTQAFREALASLSSQERNVLRLHFLEGLSFAQVGVAYQVDKSTVSRWVAKTRRTLLERTRTDLAERLKLNPQDLDSLMDLVHSQLELSINTLLRRTRS
jgi:RNA polymerase sigma-70 factor (ECF subfamily)